jgi:hypothetical protein
MGVVERNRGGRRKRGLINYLPLLWMVINDLSLDPY